MCNGDDSKQNKEGTLLLQFRSTCISGRTGGLTLYYNRISVGYRTLHYCACPANECQGCFCPKRLDMPQGFRRCWSRNTPLNVRQKMSTFLTNFYFKPNFSQKMLSFPAKWLYVCINYLWCSSNIRHRLLSIKNLRNR